MFSLIRKKFLNPGRYYFYYYLLRYQLLGKHTSHQKVLMRFPECKLWCRDPLSVLWQYKEIFLDEAYSLDSLEENALLLDCGSNVGMSLIYFRKRFPNCSLMAFEANPEIAQLLKENLKLNRIDNVEVIEKAVWKNDDGVKMSISPDDASSTQGTENMVLIPSVDFKKILEQQQEPVYIKMDIEGAEWPVLSHSGTALKKAKHLWLEYHAYYQQKQELDLVLRLLSEQGFRYCVARSYIFNNPTQPVEFVVNLIARQQA
jgi:FkbM family methyltransferase